MKKILIFTFILSIFITGCGNLMNTPTKRVEELMSKYQKNDESISGEIDTMLNEEENLTTEQRNQYKNIINKQYKNLTYEIKDEEVDGDNAVVKVEIEVTDYKKVIDELDSRYSSDATLDRNNYNNEKINELNNANEKVRYTLDINTKKDEDGNWYVTGLTTADRKKIQGMY